MYDIFSVFIKTTNKYYLVDFQNGVNIYQKAE